MGTITIHSNKADDLYFLGEMARRMNLKANIEAPKNETSIGWAVNPNKAEDKKIFEMSKSVRDNALADFLRNETEPIF